MKFYRVAVIDDESSVLDELESLLKRYAGEKGIEIMADRFLDALDFRAVKKDLYDVVFLDIEMEHSNGFDSAKALREEGFTSSIVFVTNLTSYAVAGYSVEAFDYVVKPVSYPRFSSLLDRVFRVADRDRGGLSLDVTSGGDTKRIPYNNIIYIESMGHQITIHCAGQDISVWGTLSAMEDELSQSSQFIRITSSYIINLAFVESVRGNDIHLRGTDAVLPIRKGGKKEFMSALNRYLGG